MLHKKQYMPLKLAIKKFITDFKKIKKLNKKRHKIILDLDKKNILNEKVNIIELNILNIMSFMLKFYYNNKINNERNNINKEILSFVKKENFFDSIELKEFYNKYKNILESVK
jgi:hypothetical protein